MALKRFIIEIGMCVDQHGSEPTVTVTGAVGNAIACLCAIAIIVLTMF